MCHQSLLFLLSRPNKVYTSYMYAEAQHNCLFLNKGKVFSWLWIAYSNTYVSSRSYLILICQRQDHLSKWSSKHQEPWRSLPLSHDLRCLDPSTLLTFFRGSGLFSNRVCILTLVCSVQSAFYTDRFLNNLFQTGENGAFCLMTSTQIMNTFVISLVCNHFITSGLAVLDSFQPNTNGPVSYISILWSVFET